MLKVGGAEICFAMIRFRKTLRLELFQKTSFFIFDFFSKKKKNNRHFLPYVEMGGGAMLNLLKSVATH